LSSSQSGPSSLSPDALGPVTRVLVILIACIGFLFDTYELLMFPVIGSNAVGELIQVNDDKDGTAPGWMAELGLRKGPGLRRRVPPSHPLVRAWASRLLWVAALCGGVFGLLGGWLIDRLGRKTVMVLSILAYSFSPVAAAFSTELWMLVLFRCTTFIGVCVEMVAAVTWLAELFADKRTRELVIGWTLATASLGGILVTEAYSAIVRAVGAGSLPALPFPEGHAPENVAWRLTLLTGLLPGAAILLLMPFVPESRVWQRKKQEGTLRRASFAELFSARLGLTTVVTTVLFTCVYAAAFGAIQMTPLQVVNALPDVARANAEAGAAVKAAEAGVAKTQPGTPQRQAAAADLGLARKKAAQTSQFWRGNIQRWQELGGLAGRVLLAALLIFVPSRLLLRLYLVPGLVLFPLTFVYFVHSSYAVFATAFFFCGLFTVGLMSFMSEFLPKVFPMYIRGTGSSFATNVGGRMTGTMAAILNTAVLAPLFAGDGKLGPLHVAYAAAVIGGAAFFIALLASFVLPSPSAEIEKEAETA
jgi:MFS family permease